MVRNFNGSPGLAVPVGISNFRSRANVSGRRLPADGRLQNREPAIFAAGRELWIDVQGLKFAPRILRTQRRSNNRDAFYRVHARNLKSRQTHKNRGANSKITTHV